MKLTILHHLGLGDHIICHGLVRHHAEKQSVNLFCKHHNVSSVSAMFTDLPVIILPVKDHTEALQALSNIGGFSLHILVHESDPGVARGLSFEEIFYERANVPFIEKWDKFFIPRNTSTELKPPAGPYVVIHQDERYRINIETPLPRYFIEKGLTNNVFDYRAILENAEEIHVIDSTFMFIADQLKCPGKKFVHRYARPNPAWQLPELTPDWTILT